MAQPAERPPEGQLNTPRNYLNPMRARYVSGLLAVLSAWRGK